MTKPAIQLLLDQNLDESSPLIAFHTGYTTLNKAEREQTVAYIIVAIYEYSLAASLP